MSRSWAPISRMMAISSACASDEEADDEENDDAATEKQCGGERETDGGDPGRGLLHARLPVARAGDQRDLGAGS